MLAKQKIFMTLIWGALLGFISVAFGAYAEHGLRETLTNEHFSSVMTAVRYNQLNAVMITAIGLVLVNGGKLSNTSALKWSGVLFILGTLLFSFSIYFSVLFDIPSLVNLAPIGGFTIMAAWLMLLIVGVLSKKKL